MDSIIKRMWVPCLLLLCAGVGCKDDIQTTKVKNGKESLLNLKVTTATETSTRVSGFVSDNVVEHVDILVFDVEGGNEYFSYLSDVRSLNATSQDNIKEITSTLTMKENHQKVVVIANAQSQVAATLASFPERSFKEDILNALLYSNLSVWTNESDKFQPIPMWGESESFIVTSLFDIDIELTLLRMCAKVNVVLADGVSNKFSLESIHIYNAKSRGKIVPDESVFETNDLKVVSPTMPADDLLGNPLTLSDPLYYTIVNDLMPSAYVFEAEATAAGAESEGVFLVIGGKYDTDGQTTYYRTDFIKRNEDGTAVYQPILRNHSYTFTITAVDGAGYATVEEAKNNMLSNLTTHLYEWDQGEIGIFVFNSLYVLGVSSNDIVIDGTADEHTIIVTTDYPGGWSPIIKDNPDWFEYASGSFSTVNTKDKYKFKVEENRTDTERYAYVEFRAGTLSIEVKITQLPLEEEYIKKSTSNSYMVSPGGSKIAFPIARANADKDRFNATSELTARFLWTDNENGLSENAPVSDVKIIGEGIDRMLAITTGNISGNAVVGVETGGNLIWSWHIWVTDYDPVSGPTVANNGYILMDRNLGAISNVANTIEFGGLHYQWGRKDPFIGSEGLTPYNSPTRPIYNADGNKFYWNTTAPGSNAEENKEYSIRNPYTFFTGPSTNAWFNGLASYTNLWNDANGNKTVYDPCPEGWRVPLSSVSSSPFLDLKMDEQEGNYCVKFINIGVFQCGGVINTSGLTNQVGVMGYYLTSEINNSSPYAFTFTRFSDIIARTVNAAHNGSNVRCIKE